MISIIYSSWDLIAPLFLLNIAASFYLMYSMHKTARSDSLLIVKDTLKVVLAFFICIDVIYFIYESLFLVHMVLELMILKVGLYKVWGQAVAKQ